MTNVFQFPKGQKQESDQPVDPDKFMRETIDLISKQSGDMELLIAHGRMKDGKTFLFLTDDDAGTLILHLECLKKAILDVEMGDYP